MQEQQQQQQMSSESPRKKKMTKGVRFPSRKHIMEQAKQISRRSTWAINEMIAMWGDDEEHEKQRDQLDEECDKYAKGFHDSDNINFTTVGVEHLIDDDKYDEKLQLREEAYDAVLWTQHYQREEEDEILAQDSQAQFSDSFCAQNETELSEKYQRVSKKAANLAVDEAKRLSLELKLSDTENEEESSSSQDDTNPASLSRSGNDSNLSLLQRCRQLSGRFVFSK